MGQRPHSPCGTAPDPAQIGRHGHHTTLAAEDLLELAAAALVGAPDAGGAGHATVL
ncbi:hypothetical protein ACPXCS_26260 [Streptomyces sp. DT190]|uniref:hypothetical protein n=1 Tax=unclassified Streptomyces TaxID=2593676 RepID=UPI003CFB3CCE